MIEITADMVERAAQALCLHSGVNPFDLVYTGGIIMYPLDNFDTLTSYEGTSVEELCDDGTRKPDGYKGRKPCSFLWRGYIIPAQLALVAALDPRGLQLDIPPNPPAAGVA